MRLMRYRWSLGAFLMMAATVTSPRSRTDSRRPCPHTRSYRVPSSSRSRWWTVIGFLRPTLAMFVLRAWNVMRLRDRGLTMRISAMAMDTMFRLVMLPPGEALVVQDG